VLNQLLPQPIDNRYRGHKLALWLFGLLLLMNLVIGLNSIFNGRTVASSADGIPLDTFTPAAARTVVTLFALLGLSRLALCLVGILALVRYRAMVPLMFAVFLFGHLGRWLILRAMPIPRTGTPPGSIVNLVLLGLMVVGLALSLWRQGEASSSA
jgi:hypothetical protein